MVYKVKEETIDGIANAIRAKTNSEEDIKVEDFAEEILNIETGENTTAAAESARDALKYSINAESSAAAASNSAFAASRSASVCNKMADISENWAIGEENSAKYYAEQSESFAIGENDSSKYYSEESKAWAIGIKNDSDVGSSDAQYENSAKYYAEKSGMILESIEYEIEKVNGELSQAWAIGTKGSGDDEESVKPGDAQYNNNALHYSGVSKYWADEAKSITENFKERTIAGNVFINGASWREV